nr:MAG TPA: hypothetical protein [Caudoviricetes sp.]
MALSTYFDSICNYFVIYFPHRKEEVIWKEKNL